MDENFLDFLKKEDERTAAEEGPDLESEVGEEETPAEKPTAPPAEPSHVSLAGEGQTRTRHSLKTCPCEKCQARRRELAIQFGLISPEDELEAEDEAPDQEFVGKLLTLYHTYRFTTLSVQDRELAEAWKVSSETQETLGKLGHKVLVKWLRRVGWPYKTETILVLYLGADIGIRSLEEAKIKALNEKIRKLEAANG